LAQSIKDQCQDQQTETVDVDYRGYCVCML